MEFKTGSSASLGAEIAGFYVQKDVGAAKSQQPGSKSSDSISDEVSNSKLLPEEPSHTRGSDDHADVGERLGNIQLADSPSTNGATPVSVNQPIANLSSTGLANEKAADAQSSAEPGIERNPTDLRFVFIFLLELYFLSMSIFIPC